MLLLSKLKKKDLGGPNWPIKKKKIVWGYPTLNNIIGKGPPKHLKLKRARRALQVAEGHQPTTGARKLAGRRPANFSSYIIF